MAPEYRANAPSRRQNRTGLIDHGEYEGLPIRHWRRDYVTVAPPPDQENSASQSDIWALELPLGMPKDAHLLPQHCQDLLRAARSGRIYKRPAPVEEEVDPEVLIGEKIEKKEDDPRERGFTARAWKQLPQHQEASDTEYLAKRRKGLVTMATKAAQGPMLTKTTVRRTDAAGNEYVQDVVVAPGQVVEGVIISQTPVVNDGTLATPPRRRIPIPRKKMKGPGRGRKKKIDIPPTSVPNPVTAEAPVQISEANDNLGSDGVKIEGESDATPAKSTDIDMVDDSAAPSDDDKGDEGEDEDEGMPDSRKSPSKSQQPVSSLPNPTPALHDIPSLGSPDVPMTEAPSEARPSILPVATRILSEERKTGSPLKNAPLTTSILYSPVEVQKTPLQALPDPIPEHNDSQATATTQALNIIEQTTQEATAPVAKDLPPPPPEPTVVHEAVAAEVLQEEEMLLDIVDNAKNAQIGGGAASEPPSPARLTPPPSSAPEISSAPTVPTAAEIEPSKPQAEQSSDQPVSTSEQKSEDVATKQPEQEAEEEDDFPDLLGGLERNIYKAEESISQAPSAKPVESTALSIPVENTERKVESPKKEATKSPVAVEKPIDPPQVQEEPKVEVEKKEETAKTPEPSAP